MASKVAEAIKREREKRELVDRIAALEDEVKTLSELVRQLVKANQTPSRATRGSTK